LYFASTKRSWHETVPFKKFHLKKYVIRARGAGNERKRRLSDGNGPYGIAKSRSPATRVDAGELRRQALTGRWLSVAIVLASASR